MSVCQTEPLAQGFLVIPMGFQGFKVIPSSVERLSRAWSAFRSLDKICYLQTIPSDLKLRFFRIILSFRSTVSLRNVDNHQMGDKLNAFATSCYRIMFNQTS